MSPIHELTCAEALARLDDYLDRELGSEETQAVRAHLEVCAACARAHQFEASLLIGLKQRLRHLSLPDGLRERIGALLSAERGPEP